MKEEAIKILAYDYKPFGDSLSFDKDLPRQAFGSEERDEEMAYYQMGRRLYDPAIGRFMAVDPLFESFPGQSPYNYSFNSPMQWRDPTGMAPQKEKRRDRILVYLGEAETSQAMGNTADDYMSLLSVPKDPLDHNAMYSYGMSDEFHWLATGCQGIGTPGGGSGSAGGGRTGGDGAENGIQSSNGSISNSVNESAVGDKEIVKEKDLKTKEGKDYPYVEQETPDYCVPANLQAANEFYDVDRNKSQKQMMFEGDKQIKTPWVDDLKYFLNMNSYSTFGEYLSLDGIINSIDQNIPVLVGVNKSPNSLGDFHLVTITGYSVYKNGSFELRIMNPDPSHTLKVINDLNQIKIRSFINLKRKNY